MVDWSTETWQEVIILCPIMPFHENTFMSATQQIGTCNKGIFPNFLDIQ